MVVTLMNLQRTFEDLDTFLVGWTFRSFCTHIHPNIVMQIVPGRPLALEVEMCPFHPGASLSCGEGRYEGEGALADHVLLCVFFFLKRGIGLF